MTLQSLGWNDHFAQAFAPYAADGLLPGRVISEHRGQYGVATDSGELAAELGGKLRHVADRRLELPAIGDFVALRPGQGDGVALVCGLLPRRTAFVRRAAGDRTEEQVVAANLDTVFIISALDRDFNLRRLERYLTLAWESGASPVILLNKADVCDAPELRRSEAARIAIAAPVHLLCALTAAGLAELAVYLRPGQTIGVLGSSGVGKSTLINQLLGRAIQATQQVQSGSQRGRHTTTHRALFMLPGGALIIDTPGMRELQLWGASEGLQTTFTDIEELAAGCRFSPCQHDRDAGCAVRAAVDRGELPADRLESYFKLSRELRYLESQKDEQRKRADKLANKAMKQFKNRR